MNLAARPGVTGAPVAFRDGGGFSNNSSGIEIMTASAANQL